MKALISIHDVMPETLDRVEALIERLRARDRTAITLLVVPGRAWDETDIARLAAWSRQGMELAAHGWQHHARRIHGLWHRLHALFISRDAAEHLALTTAEIEQLMRDSAIWFEAHDLPTPTSYIPPAWALGRLPRARLAALPYQQVEVTRGVIDCRSGRLHALPLVGFEADTAFRAAFLRCWNRFQAHQARRSGRPLRIGIHPGDAELRLADQLAEFIDGHWTSHRLDDRAAVF
ncbi:polysaccharide deacetylase family protein [Thiohalophilus sp.]|uniref:polysaccharide deacetylase family protein n=1 Tax=Thiohalophilus sp. TaxID=3028392 RepID=UPI002ACE875A|nr:polysaccharide deacetylase family protein [Thiohalophilus sp.]MDZ7802583.1 polysaccharide deacetylase family protein [Thiohalophilus sp.]